MQRYQEAINQLPPDVRGPCTRRLERFQTDLQGTRAETLLPICNAARGDLGALLDEHPRILGDLHAGMNAQADERLHALPDAETSW